MWRLCTLSEHFPQPCPRLACTVAFPSGQSMTAFMVWVLATFRSVGCCAVLLTLARFKESSLLTAGLPLPFTAWMADGWQSRARACVPCVSFACVCVGPHTHRNIASSCVFHAVTLAVPLAAAQAEDGLHPGRVQRQLRSGRAFSFEAEALQASAGKAQRGWIPAAWSRVSESSPRDPFIAPCCSGLPAAKDHLQPSQAVESVHGDAPRG